MFFICKAQYYSIVDIDYLLLFTNQGIPVFSYKFSEDFGIKDEVLFSAFLASLNQVKHSKTSFPDKLKLDDHELQLSYS